VPLLILLQISAVQPQDPYSSFNNYTPKRQIGRSNMFHTPKGYYLDTDGEEKVCPRGFYCPVDTTVDTMIPCGDVSVFCPEGSHSPTLVDKGHYTVSAVEDG
jgi:hypothetical protein